MELVLIGCRLLFHRHLLSPVSLRLGLLSLLITKLHACDTARREAAECPMTFLETGRCAEKGSSQQGPKDHAGRLLDGLARVGVQLTPEQEIGDLPKRLVVLVNGLLRRRLLLRLLLGKSRRRQTWTLTRVQRHVRRRLGFLLLRRRWRLLLWRTAR
jgi:hypothetical protein